MLLATAASEKENKLFDENKAANVRVQIANEELAKLSVNFDHSKSECQSLKAERDKLVEENSRIANSEATLEQKVRSLSKEIERLEVLSLTCLLWISPMQNLMYSMQGMEKQQSISIQNLEKRQTEDEVLRQSMVKHNSAEDEVPKIFFPF